MTASVLIPAMPTNNWISPFTSGPTPLVQNPFAGGSTISTNTMSVDKLTVGGQELSAFIKNVNQRLAILSPDLEKLAHFQSLRIAYDNYLAIEALCTLPITK